MSSNISHHAVTANNRGPAVNVVSWFLNATAVLFVVARLATKLALDQHIQIDDGVVIASLVFSIALVVTISLETEIGGLGQHQSSLSDTNLEVFQKTAYAGDIFYVLSLVLSKFSLLILLRLITPVKLQLRLISGLEFAIALWGLSALVTLVFQCRPPRVWQLLSGQCFDKVAFWDYYQTSNIILEGLLVALPIAIIWNVQMRLLRKFIIIWCFAMRVMVIGAIISELIFRNRVKGSKDYTYASWPVVVCSQFVQVSSIVTACIPYLKPFFASLESGMIRSDDSRRLDSRSTWSYGHRRPSGQKKSWASTILSSIGSRNVGAGTVAVAAVSSHGDVLGNLELMDRNYQAPDAWETGSYTSEPGLIHAAAV